MTHALVFGKFYPPHEGHHYVIDLAASECTHVTVLVWGHPSEELSLTRKTRVELLKDRHPGSKFTWWEAENTLPVDFSSRRHDRMHAEALQAIIQTKRGDLPYPDRLYGSEPYINHVAADLTEISQHLVSMEPRIVDLKRVAKPISASKFRANPVAHWDFLAPGTKAHFARRVVVCGAESSGTTTLARALAERYQTVWVPEWGRTFAEAVGLSYRWATEDFELIAEQQQRQEDLLARFAGPVLFCDTDAYATAMFHELYMHARAPLGLWSMATRRPADLYVVTHDEGVAFEDDGYRLFEGQRRWATEWFERKLPQERVVVVGGTHEERMNVAVEAVDDVLRWDFAPPGDA